MPSLQLPEKLEGLLAPNRYKVAYGGRGSAKSWSVAAALVMMATMRPVRILCARETQKSIQESVHRLIKDTIGRLGVESLFEVQETRIIGRNGSDFAFAGIRQQNVANLKSFEGVDVCWVEEAQVVSKRSWDVLVPTIRKPGSEIWITFNPELDSDETYTRFVLDPPEDAWVVQVNWHDNPWFGAELEQERRLMERRDPIGYETIWMGKCRPAVEGAIYSQELDLMIRQGRITTVSHDPQLPVHTVWDLGYNDQTVILMVQRIASEIRVIDCLIRRFTTYDDDVTELKQRPYVWGTDWLPHDARHKLKSANGRSAEMIVSGMGRTVRIVELADVEDGIKNARTAFRRLWADKEKCSDWINSLKRYKRHKSANGQVTGSPVHDDASHGADALRYLAQIAGQLETVANSAPSKPYTAGWVR
jgi:phage terminase large subunit